MTNKTGEHDESEKKKRGKEGQERDERARLSTRKEDGRDTETKTTPGRTRRTKK